MTDLEKSLYALLTMRPLSSRYFADKLGKRLTAVSSRLAIMASKGWVRRAIVDDTVCYTKTEKFIEAWSEETGEPLVLTPAGLARKRMQSNKLSKLGNDLCKRAFNSGVAL